MRKRNRMKPTAALMLALSLLLALLLPGCDALSSGGKSAPKDWDTTIDITDAFNDALKETLGDYVDNEELLDSIKIKNFTIDVTVSVDDDGEYGLTVDEKRLERTLDDVFETLFDSMEGSADGGSIASAPSTGDDRLVGNWVYSLDLTDMLYDELESTMGDDIEYFSFHNFSLNVNLSFSSGGTVRMSIDEAALERSLNTLINDLVDGVEVYFDAYAREEGIDMTLEEYLASEGYTMDDFVDEMLDQAGFDMDDIMSSVSGMNISGTYEADGSNLTVFTSSGSNVLPYTLSGNKLTLHSDTGGMLGDTMVFTKK